MKKLLFILSTVVFVAIVAPELRPLLVVGAFCWFGGFVVGTQHRAKSEQELAAVRLVRGVQL